MGECNKSDCHNEAETGVAIMTPATGWPIDMHQPLRVVVSLCVCDKCFDELKKEDFLTPQIQKIIEIQARISGSNIPPDFTRTFLSRVNLESKEYKMFEQNRSKPQ